MCSSVLLQQLLFCSGAEPYLDAVLKLQGWVQAPAAAALDSLAYRSLKHRQEMAAAGVLQPLISFLQQCLDSPPDPGALSRSNPFAPDQPIRPALNLLHSLALDAPAHRREIASCGAIPALVRLMGADTPLQPVHLAQTAGILSRMGADGQDFRDAILSAGAVPALVSMLQGPGSSSAGQEQAMGALEMVAAGGAACRAAIISADGAPAFVRLLDAGVPHLRRRAAAALAALMTDGGPALHSELACMAAPKLVELVLTPPDPETQVCCRMLHLVSSCCHSHKGFTPGSERS